MSKFTIEQLFYGKKYNIMGEVIKSISNNSDMYERDPDAFREIEIVRQTLITVEKMRENGDGIAEGELSDTVVTFL